MNRYEVIPYMVWQHKTGKRVSIYGASPYRSDKDKEDWEIITDGWTIQDNHTNTIGMGRKPFKEELDALKLVNQWNKV